VNAVAGISRNTESERGIVDSGAMGGGGRSVGGFRTKAPLREEISPTTRRKRKKKRLQKEPMSSRRHNEKNEPKRDSPESWPRKRPYLWGHKERGADGRNPTT